MDGMATVTLDTHRIVKRLKDAGFTDTQAEMVTDIIVETRTTNLADIATMPDLATLAAKADVAGRERKSSNGWRRSCSLILIKLLP